MCACSKSRGRGANLLRCVIRRGGGHALGIPHQLLLREGRGSSKGVAQWVVRRCAQGGQL